MEPTELILTIRPEEVSDLRRAKGLLENPGLPIRLANVIGTPIERGFELLPQRWSQPVNKAARVALLKALELAVFTLEKKPREPSSESAHKLLVGASGFFGGAFGLAALAIELPISTTIILRSIADIARSEGHDLGQTETKLSCLEVFALGGKASSDDSAESGYWAVRAALAKAVSEAAAYLAHKGVLEKSAPAIVRLIGAIAARFGVVVSEQVAAKAVPVVGAASGLAINVLFMQHFQQMARGHFIVKRLESKYGSEPVQHVYQSLAMPMS